MDSATKKGPDTSREDNLMDTAASLGDIIKDGETELYKEPTETSCDPKKCGKRAHATILIYDPKEGGKVEGHDGDKIAIAFVAENTYDPRDTHHEPGFNEVTVLHELLSRHAA